MTIKKKRIISYRIARELIRQGFRVIDIEPNNINKERTVFIFENNIALQTYLKQHRKEVINNDREQDNETDVS